MGVTQDDLFGKGVDHVRSFISKGTPQVPWSSRYLHLKMHDVLKGRGALADKKSLHNFSRLVSALDDLFKRLRTRSVGRGVNGEILW